MKKEELFDDEFLKQFKTGDELNGFLKELQKRGIEKMLEGELDGHWIMTNTKNQIRAIRETGFPKRRYALLSGNPK